LGLAIAKRSYAMSENQEEAGSAQPEVAQETRIWRRGVSCGSQKHGRPADARDVLCTAEAERKESDFVGILVLRAFL
jgi:hypothetical protein